MQPFGPPARASLPLLQELRIHERRLCGHTVNDLRLPAARTVCSSTTFRQIRVRWMAGRVCRPGSGRRFAELMCRVGAVPRPGRVIDVSCMSMRWLERAAPGYGLPRRNGTVDAGALGSGARHRRSARPWTDHTVRGAADAGIWTPSRIVSPLQVDAPATVPPYGVVTTLSGRTRRSAEEAVPAGNTRSVRGQQAIESADAGTAPDCGQRHVRCTGAGWRTRPRWRALQQTVPEEGSARQRARCRGRPHASRRSWHIQA